MPAPAQPERSASRSVLLIVFTTILIDFIGFSVLIPVLPLYAEKLGASDLQVGFILTVYALAQLLFLPIWGWVSDRVGRRPVILVSLFGTVISFIVLSFAESIELIYLSRALAGFFAASIGTAQAVVTDVTPPEERARGMGFIGAAFGAGMVIGPVIGGVAAVVDPRMPFYVVAVLAAANFVLAWVRLPESRPAELDSPGWPELKLAMIPTPIRLVTVVHDRRIGLYLYLFLHMFTAFAVLEALFTLYVGKRFGSSALEVSAIYAWIGVFIFVTQGFALRRLVARWGESRLVMFGLFAMAVGLVAIAFVPSYAWFFAVGPIIAFGNGLAFPTFTSLYSKACRAESAGELLGQSQSMATTGRIIGPAAGGWVMQSWDLEMPFLVSGAMMLLALLLFRATQKMLVEDEPTQEPIESS
jgi:multidrug resistance protein